MEKFSRFFEPKKRERNRIFGRCMTHQLILFFLDFSRFKKIFEVGKIPKKRRSFCDFRFRLTSDFSFFVRAYLIRAEKNKKHVK